MGKTTLIIRVLENLRASNPNLKVQGFYTRKFSVQILQKNSIEFDQNGNFSDAVIGYLGR